MLGFSNIYSKAPLGSCVKIISRIKNALDELQIQINLPQSDVSNSSTMSSSTSSDVTSTAGISPKMIVVSGNHLAQMTVLNVETLQPINNKILNQDLSVRSV